MPAEIELTETVVIEGCGIPRWLYNFVKQTARVTGKTQSVGVDYTIPAELARQPGETHSETWGKAESRYYANVERIELGEGCAYIIGMSADRLRKLANVPDRTVRIAAILHISPLGD